MRKPTNVFMSYAVRCLDMGADQGVCFLSSFLHFPTGIAASGYWRASFYEACDCAYGTTSITTTALDWALDAIFLSIAAETQSSQIGHRNQIPTGSGCDDEWYSMPYSWDTLCMVFREDIAAFRLRWQRFPSHLAVVIRIPLGDETCVSLGGQSVDTGGIDFCVYNGINSFIDYFASS